MYPVLIYVFYDQQAKWEKIQAELPLLPERGNAFCLQPNGPLYQVMGITHSFFTQTDGEQSSTELYVREISRQGFLETLLQD